MEKAEAAPRGDASFDELQRNGGGRRTALFNLCNIALGSGVLGFPAAYHAGGYLYTTAFIAAFALLGCFSNSIMIRCCSWHRVVSFQGVVREALGPRIATVAAIAMVVYSFGGCAAFLVIIGDFLEPPCSHASAALGWAEADGEASSSAAGDGSAAAPGACSRQVLIVAVGLTVVLPLSLRAQITFLGAPSRFAIVGVVFLSLAVVFRSASAVAERGLASGVVPFVDTAAGVIGPTGTVAWSFAVMLGIPSVFAELQAGAGDGTRLLGGAQRDSEELQQLTERRSRAERQQGGFDGGGLDEVEVSAEEAGRVAEMDGVIRQQAVLTAACYVAVGVGGYAQFGDGAGEGAGNVLNLYASRSAAQSDLLIDTARVALAVVVAVSFPVIHFTSRLMLFDLCCEARAWLGAGPGSEEPSPTMSAAVRTALTLGFWGCCTAFAVAGYELGFIFAVFGSTCSVSTMLFVPGLLLLNESGPWRHRAYRSAMLCGCKHSYGGRRRRVVGVAMLGGGVLTCGLSLALIAGAV